MALNGLTAVTIGVPNVPETTSYYLEFGLNADSDGWLTTLDGGRQLRLVQAPARRLIEMELGADDFDDIDRLASSLQRAGVSTQRFPGRISAVERITGVRTTVVAGRRVVQKATPSPLTNRPGRFNRTAQRASGVLRTQPVRPRKLGHAVLGTTDLQATQRFFVDGLGFKVSDIIPEVGSFLRCSTDHHNVLVMRAPVCFLHHTSWQVDDIDEVGRGAMAMLEADPSRHVWGLGRHYAGSNFFWYLKDPAGNFSEYYADMDYIPDDQVWTPEMLEGAKGYFSWGPPPPPSFIRPDDLAELMTGAHSMR